MNASERSDPSSSTSAASAAGASIVLVSASVERLTEGRRIAGAMIAASDEEASKVARGTHPDVLELLAPEGKQRIGIRQIRDVIRAAQFAPSEAPHKICLVPVAEELTIEAANALLKILEEPPRGLRFVLLAEHASDLLPTIVSRSRLVRACASSRADTVERLTAAGCEPSEAQWLVSLPLHEDDLDRLLESPREWVASADRFAQSLPAVGTAALLDVCMGDNPVARAQGLICVLDRIAARDSDLLTEGVRLLANQPRDLVARLLGDLLTVGFALVRAPVHRSPQQDRLGDRVRTSFGVRHLRDFCLAVDRAYQALSVYGPIEGILLSLFLTSGEEPT